MRRVRMAAAALWRGPLELHFPADENSVTVTDKNGKSITVSGGNGKYTFTMPSSKITVTPLFSKIEETKPETSPFDDVTANDYFYDAVKWAADKDITGGRLFSLSFS